MNVGGLRRKSKTGEVVATGSVWESRMKRDEYNGGIKAFNGKDEDDDDENGNNESQGNDDDVCNKSTIDEAQVVDDNSKKVNLNMRSPPKQKNVVVGTNGNGGGFGKRKTWKSESFEGGNPKQRSDMVKNVDDDKSNGFSVSDNGIIIKKSAILRKTRSAMAPEKMEKEKDLSRLSLEVVESKKTRSQSIMPPTPTFESRKSKSELVLDDLDENAKNSSPQSNKLCEENDEKRIEKGGVVGVTGDTPLLIAISSSNVDKSLPKGVDDDEEIEVENTSLVPVVKEISNVAEQKTSKDNVLIAKEKNLQTYHSSNLRKPTVPVSPIVKKQSPSIQSNQSKLHFTNLPSKSKPNTNDSRGIPTTHSKMQSIVDLVMWRDVSRTAFVFGIGTFCLISSSYTKDLNISLISVVSYVGLLYLAAIFLFRSFISRGNEMNDSSMEYVFGEEEAIRLVTSTLPYVNECLLNLKALFSGDPATTIKMAVMLYVLARCGSYITIWKMAKLSFFGVFTIPKICSSYSKHLTNYGAIWIGRIREGWESCNHKKAVGFAIFTLFWNLSSYIARIWAVFVLFVAFRFYHQQQSMIEEEASYEYPSQPDAGATQRQRTRPISVDTGGKLKKMF